MVMNKTIKNAMEELEDWLSDPSELGKKLTKIEYTNAFADEDGINCLVFKYKKNLFGWSNRIRTYIVLFLYTGNPRELSMSGNCVGLGLDWNLWKKASTDEFYRQGNGRSYKW